jgi:phosphopantetheinyl transferase
MPLSKIEFTDDGGWALWHITETHEALAQAVTEKCPIDITASKKQLEWLASRMLVQHLTEKAGLTFHGIYKDEFGKPFLTNLNAHISLSHSYPYVAAQLNFATSVGIDIEQPSAKIMRVAHRVFDETEQADAGSDKVKNCVYWCAKEALYKWYGKRGLSFALNLKVTPFTLLQQGEILGSVIMTDVEIEIPLYYHIEQELVVVVTN